MGLLPFDEYSNVYLMFGFVILACLSYVLNSIILSGEYFTGGKQPERVPEGVPQRMPGWVYERATHHQVPEGVPNWEPGDYEFSDESEEEEEEYLVPFVFNDRKAKKNAPTCVICLTNRVMCKNMPCGCSVMCGECATKLIRKTDICPTCRAEIKQIKVL